MPSRRSILHSEDPYELPLDIKQYGEGLYSTLQKILGLKPDQKVIIVTSYASREDRERLQASDPKELRGRRETYTMAKFLQRAAIDYGYAAEFISYPATFQNGKEPPANIRSHILSHAAEGTVYIFMPWDSLTHTDLTTEVCSKGGRVMSSPHFTAAMMENEGPMCADYAGIRQRSEKLANLIGEAEYDTIWSPDGTDITVYFLPDTEAIVDPRDLSVLSPNIVERYGNFPAGEAFRAIGPHAKSNGTIVGYLKGQKVQIKVENGCAVKVLSRNRSSREMIRAMFEDGDDVELAKRRQLCEDGTGTNDLLAQDIEKWWYSTLTAEKLDETKHLAFGNNMRFGGRNNPNYHQDLVILRPTAELSTGIRYITDGKLSV